MSEKWPTAPIINILEGTYRGESVQNVLAIRSHSGNGYVEAGGGYDFNSSRPEDTILRWEDVAVVPVNRLKNLRRAWYGPGGENAHRLRTVEVAIRDILDALPNREAPVTEVARRSARHPVAGVRLEDSLRARVIALFRAVDAVNTYGDRVYALTKMVRLVSDWANLEDPEDDAMAYIQDRAWDIYSPGHSDRRSVVMLARLVGQVTEAAASDKALRPTLISLGSYALAWAAELIEEARDYEEEDDE